MDSIQTIPVPGSKTTDDELIICHIVCAKAQLGEWAISICGQDIGIYKGDEEGDYDCVACEEMVEMGLCNGGSVCDCEDGNEFE